MLVPHSEFLKICCVLIFTCSLTLLSAASVVQVDRLEFDKVGRDEWLRCRLQLNSTGNPIEHARNARFLDSLKIHLYLSFEDRKNGFSFYCSEVEVVTLEQGQSYIIDFFLPGQVVKRDRLGTTPFAYLLEFEVSGFGLPFDSSFASANMAGESARASLIKKVNDARNSNDGILLPSYLAPFHLTMEYEAQYPPYRRNEPLF